MTLNQLEQLEADDRKQKLDREDAARFRWLFGYGHDELRKSCLDVKWRHEARVLIDAARLTEGEA